MKKLLEVQDLHLSFKVHGKIVKAVDGASFTLYEGERLGIVGESGSGKSALVKAILKLLPSHTASIDSGQIWYKDQDLTKLPEKALQKVRGSEISMIFQDPMTSLNPTLKVGFQIREGTKADPIELLRQVGVPDPEKRVDEYPHTLSGGLRQRVMIALALARNPALLIADEPTTSLDVTIQAQILELLKSLRQTLILITHDLSLVAGFCDRVLVMREGKIVEEAPVEKIFSQAEHPYTRQLLSSIPSLYAASLPSLSSPPLLSVKNLKKHYGAVKALDGVTFDILAGETFALVGESGCGKSTLGKTILQLEAPTAGTIETTSLTPFRQKAQVIFQDPYASLNPRMTIEDILKEPLHIHRFPLGDKKIDELLRLVHLPLDFKYRFPHELSGGQKQRVGIARALALSPSFVVCDEPLSALDVSIQAQIAELLKQLQADLGLTLLFISHDLRMVKHLSNRVGVMYLGLMMELSSTAELYLEPLHPYTQSLLSAIPLPDPEAEKSRPKIILHGEIPSPSNPPKGCVFCTRCPKVMPICHKVRPELKQISPGRHVACHLYEC